MNIDLAPNGLILSIITTLGFDVTSIKVDSPESMFVFGLLVIVALFFLCALMFAIFRFVANLFRGVRL